MQVHGAVEDQVAVGVESTYQLLSVVVEVGLDLEPVPLAEQRPGVHEIAGEPVVEHLGAAVGDLGHRPGNGQSGERAVTRFGVVVVAAPETGIEGQSGAPHGAPRHLLGGGLQGGGDGGDSPDSVGKHHAPLQDLHATHGPPDDGQPPVNAQMVSHRGLTSDDVTGSHRGKRRTVGDAGRRVDRGRSGGPLASTQRVHANHEVTVGIDSTTGSDAAVPPALGRVAVTDLSVGMAVAGQGMADQDGVVDRWRELPPRLERHGDVGQDATALQDEGATGAHRGELSVPHRIAWQPSPGDRQVRRVGARMTGLVDGGPVTAHPFVRHEAGLLTGRTPALCADSGTRRPAGGHFVALPGHIPTVAGE